MFVHVRSSLRHSARHGFLGFSTRFVFALALAALLATGVGFGGILPAPRAQAAASIGVPAVAKNDDGRLEVFQRRSDGHLWHTWQVTPNGGWSSWYSFGGALASDPVVGGNFYQRLEVFALWTDGTLRHIWQLTPGGGWSSWTPMARPMGVTFQGAISVIRDASGSLIVIARMSDDVLYRAVQLTPNNSNDWSNWDPLNPAGYSYPTLGSPATGINEDGRIEIFAAQTTNGPSGYAGALRHDFQPELEPGVFILYGPWPSLGGTITSVPVVANNYYDQRLEVFARGTNNALYHTSERAKNSSSDWSGWSSLDGTLTSAPAVALNQSRELDVFVRGTDGGLWHKSQNAPGSASWSSWQSLGGTLGTAANGGYDPVHAVGVNEDGRLEVFAKWNDGTIHHIYQLATGMWSNWYPL